MPVSDETRRRSPYISPSKPLTVTIDDTSRITGLGNTKIYELINQGQLKSVTIGRRRLVLYSSIEALLQARSATRRSSTSPRGRPATGGLMP